MIIYADADDEVLPAAGTLRLISQAGWNVHCLILTDSNLSSSAVKGKRHQEAEAVGEVIGATYVHTLEESNFLTQAVQAKTLRQLNGIIVLSRLWTRELCQKDGYFEAFEIARKCVKASLFTTFANRSDSALNSSRSPLHKH